MKTMQDVMLAPHDSTPMELMLATMEMMIAGARMAVEKNDAAGLSAALSHLINTASTVKGWVESNDPKAKA